jgi:hypothetical protein
MRTREEITADWNSDTGPTRDKVNRLWLELFLDIRELVGEALSSDPPAGAKAITNLYVNDGKTVVEYEDNPA